LIFKKKESFEQSLLDMNGCVFEHLIFYLRLLVLNNWSYVSLTSYFNVIRCIY